MTTYGMFTALISFTTLRDHEGKLKMLLKMANFLNQDYIFHQDYIVVTRGLKCMEMLHSLEHCMAPRGGHL